MLEVAYTVLLVAMLLAAVLFGAYVVYRLFRA